MFWILILFFVLLGIWGVMLYIRKSLWDVVHRNLLDLEDQYGGSVIRNNAASRPVYRSKISGVDFTINFSSGKVKDKRVHYINITYGATSHFSGTIASLDWLNSQEGANVSDALKLQNNQSKAFMIRPASSKEIQKFVKTQLPQQLINGIKNLAYFFLGQSGFILEIQSDRLADDCKIENLNPIITLLKKLGKALNDR
jgi:hypothetical protein